MHRITLLKGIRIINLNPFKADQMSLRKEHKIGSKRGLEKFFPKIPEFFRKIF